MTGFTYTCHEMPKFVMFLPNFMLLQTIYQRRQMRKPFSLPYRQAPVKI